MCSQRFNSQAKLKDLMKSRQSALALRWLEFQKLKELRNDFKELRNELKELPYDFALALRGIEEEQ